MQAEKEKASKKKELKQAEARMNERVKKAFKKSSRCENMDNGYEYYNDFRDYFHPDEDHIIIGYNYKILHHRAFKKDDLIENVLKYFFAIRCGFGKTDTDSTGYCLVTKDNLTQILPLNQTIREYGLETGVQVESMLFHSILNCSSRSKEGKGANSRS